MATSLTPDDSDDTGIAPVAAAQSESAPGPAEAAFPIVGIGASAGGLEAIGQLLSVLPPDAGMAFVLVQHLDPRHESRLVDILTKSTRLSVREAGQGMQVNRDQVYVIPPNTTMTLSAGRLKLVPRTESRAPHLPIDQFFKSLALDRQSGAIGVILSGTGSDGTLGLEEIKAAGGITFAQDEDSAKFRTMPASAIQSGCIDMVLAPDGIARELVRIGRHPYLASTAPPPDEPSDESWYRKILALLRTFTGVDFHGYRDTTVRRRILRRMALHMKHGLPEYVQQLEQDSAELQALYHDILINVTSFFRDAEAFDALKQHVFPEIVNNKSTSKPIRIWVPGCSSGQEAYSLAIALLEFLDASNASIPIQIFASDLSDAVALQKARDGIYPDSIEADVSAERLQRYFIKDGSSYRVRKSLRDICVFARQNVAADPPFSHVDLISCRNLLIYLAPPLQKRVLPIFHYALNSPGFLLLGGAESIGTYTELFKAVDARNRIYRKLPRAVRDYPTFAPPQFAGSGHADAHAPRNPVLWRPSAEHLLLEHHEPAGMLINERLDVLQFRGSIGDYMKPAAGDTPFNALTMAREGLLLDLRSALSEARERDTETRRHAVRVKTSSGATAEVNIQVQPVTLPGQRERCFMVSFSDASMPGETWIASSGPPPRKEGWVTKLSAWLAAAFSGVPADHAAERRDLRRELGTTREYLQAVIEQQDAANEELKSANEEILSSNEELQSTNEELETAKEELESVNEELTTVNDQLQSRNVDLILLNDDCNNLFSSANVPMVALGVDLRIRRFTPSAAKLLNLLPADIGRPQ